MPAVALFLVAALVFLAADAVMLTLVLEPLFRRTLGDQLAESFRLLPAVLFYLLYMAGLLRFVTLPAFRAGSVAQAARDGAVFGLVAYGTFELTSWAVMARWTPALALTDMAWGAAVTAASAAAAVAAARALGLRG